MPPRPRRLRPDYIVNHRASIMRDIVSLRANRTYVDRVGGSTSHNLNEEIAFQEKRADFLLWCGTKTFAELSTELDRRYTDLGADGVAVVRGGIIRGLPVEQMEDVCTVHLLEHVLDQHRQG